MGSLNGQKKKDDESLEFEEEHRLRRKKKNSIFGNGKAGRPIKDGRRKKWRDLGPGEGGWSPAVRRKKELRER